MRAASTPEGRADTRYAQLFGIGPKQRPAVIFECAGCRGSCSRSRRTRLPPPGHDASGDAPGNERGGEVAIRGFDMP